MTVRSDKIVRPLSLVHRNSASAHSGLDHGFACRLHDATAYWKTPGMEPGVAHPIQVVPEKPPGLQKLGSPLAFELSPPGQIVHGTDGFAGSGIQEMKRASLFSFPGNQDNRFSRGPRFDGLVF